MTLTIDFPSSHGDALFTDFTSRGSIVGTFFAIFANRNVRLLIVLASHENMNQWNTVDSFLSRIHLKFTLYGNHWSTNVDRRTFQENELPLNIDPIFKCQGRSTDGTIEKDALTTWYNDKISKAFTNTEAISPSITLHLINVGIASEWYKGRHRRFCRDEETDGEGDGGFESSVKHDKIGWMLPERRMVFTFLDVLDRCNIAFLFLE